jgi:frataxin-like iron-binding protein CyaY
VDEIDLGDEVEVDLENKVLTVKKPNGEKKVYNFEAPEEDIFIMKS